ncbi:hypothetical protein [Xanthomonas sacchari]
MNTLAPSYLTRPNSITRMLNGYEDDMANFVADGKRVYFL